MEIAPQARRLRMPDIGSRSAVRCSPLACALALLVPLSATADDIDVYRAGVVGSAKPNVLFVLDYSGSMQEDVLGGDAAVSGQPKKIDVLKGIMSQLLLENEDTIRAGVGIYGVSGGGVRWPAGDLRADAHTVDPDIPSGAFSSREVIEKQLDRLEATHARTRTVDALLEAGLYFRGAKVGNGGAQLNEPDRHVPDVWNVVQERYLGGSHETAIAATYSPDPGYLRGVHVDGNVGYCTDSRASGGRNDCEGKVLIDCTTHGGGTHTFTDDAGNAQTVNVGQRDDCSYQHPDDWLEPNYLSPITQSCQANAIVLISDGLPNRTLNQWPLREIIGTDVGGCEDLGATIFSGEPLYDGNCGPEVVRELANEPQVDGVADSTVSTYAIGLSVNDTGADYLGLLAREGDGLYFDADSADALVGALTAILSDIGVSGSQSFAELSVDVDRATFSSADRAYFGLFEPSGRRGWQGNLKGYFVGPDGFTDTNGQPAVLDTPDGRRFAPEAQSFWSREVDGDTVGAGGASARLADAERALYTYLGANDTIPASGVPLAGLAVHELRSANVSLRAEDLGLASGAPERDEALDWLQTAPMGDPLHSLSVSVDYGARQVVYVMTNQGLLHAIDASGPLAPGNHEGGREIFAFMPRRLLPNLPRLAQNLSDGSHVYGLDGGITRWHEDDNQDGVVNGDDTLLLVVGMRRGGDAYHAIDVTDPTAPRLMWAIDSETAGFSRLAQSWSRASLVNVARGGTEQPLLMFGGGYDAAVLDDRPWPRAARGNAIFVVDRSGSLVRRFDEADHPAMRHSLAADLTPIDSDGDGLADRIYAADLGGQVWRIDFDDIANSATSRVTLLADLHDGDSQPFFYAPSVALNAGASGEFLSIALGSGNRTEPLDESTANALYLLQDTDVEKGPPAAGFETIEVSALYDASANAIGSDEQGVAQGARDAMDAARGWRVSLAAGEKALSGLLSFEGELLATTYQVDAGGSTNPCSLGSIGRFYRMDIATAQPVPDQLGGADPEPSGPSDRWRELAGGRIPSKPVVLFPPGSGTVRILVDSELVGRAEQGLTSVFWYAR